MTGKHTGIIRGIFRAIFWIWLSLSFLPGNPASAEEKYYGDIEKIVAKGTIVVAAYSNDLPPFIFKNADGSLGGLDVELAQDIAKRLGVSLVFERPTDNFNALADLIMARKADVIISAFSITPKRAMKIHFTADYLRLHKALMVNRLKTAELLENSQNIGALNKEFVVIGANEGSVYADLARELFPKATIKLYKSHRLGSADMLAGQIHGYLCDQTCADSYNHPREWHKTQPPANWGLMIRTITLSEGDDPIAMATHYDDRAVNAWLNIYLSQIKADGSLERLVKKYID